MKKAGLNAARIAQKRGAKRAKRGKRTYLGLALDPLHDEHERDYETHLDEWLDASAHVLDWDDYTPGPDWPAA